MVTFTRHFFYNRGLGASDDWKSSKRSLAGFVSRGVHRLRPRCRQAMNLEWRLARFCPLSV